MSAALEKRTANDDGQQLTPMSPGPVTLFGTDEPEQVIEQATRSAKALAEVVKKQKLTTPISGREHVRVEGWTLLGSMLGVFPVCVWTKPLEDGWEARVEARTRNGEVVGAAEAECLRSESKWKTRDDYALRSMAQTRATSKALRAPLGFVMQLAGFDPTPAEEMPRDDGGSAFREPKAKPAQVKKLNELVDALVAEKLLNDRGQVERGAERDYGTPSFAELSGAQITDLTGKLERFAKNAREAKDAEEIPFA